MDQASLESLQDVTARIDHVEEIIDGKRVTVPKLVGFQVALFQKEDDGVFTDADGVEWMTGWVNGERVRRKFRQ